MFSLHYTLKGLSENELHSVRQGDVSNVKPSFDCQFGLGLDELLCYGTGKDSLFRGANLRSEIDFLNSKVFFIVCSHLVLEEVIGKYQNFEFQNTSGYLANI